MFLDRECKVKQISITHEGEDESWTILFDCGDVVMGTSRLDKNKALFGHVCSVLEPSV